MTKYLMGHEGSLENICENVRLTVGAKHPVSVREILDDYVACALHPLRSFDSLTSFAHVICRANRGIVLILFPFESMSLVQWVRPQN